MKRSIKAIIVSVTASVAGFVNPPGPYYNNSSNETGADGWVTFDTPITFADMGELLGRLGSFVIGTNPDDPAVGPLITGIFVMGMVVATTGSSRSGVVGGVVLGVATVAVLAQGLALAPAWVYGAVVFVIGIIGAALLIQLMS